MNGTTRQESRPFEWPEGECTYSLEALRQAHRISNDTLLRSYITSQINMYNTNCILYVERIERRLQQLGIEIL